ncbi:MAG: hypothetical protein EZS28_042678, partial [Streblomastix strix]
RRKQKRIKKQWKENCSEMREYTIELRRQGTEYCPVGALEKWLQDGNCWKGDDRVVWINIEKQKALSPQGCGQVLRNVLDEICIEKEYGGVTIRHAMMTKL